MAAPQRNYPYNPQLAKALAFNRNDPQFNSVMSIYGSDAGHEGDVLPQAIQPDAGGNQVQQGLHVLAEVAEGVLTGQNAPSVEPALIAADASAIVEQALAVGVSGSADPSSEIPASNATEDAVAQVNAHHETALLQVDRAGPEPEAGPSGCTSLRGHTRQAVHIPSPANGSDTAHKTTSDTSASASSTSTTTGSTKSRRGRAGAATPARPPRRSIRETALRTAQRVHDILVPKPRRGRKSTAATNNSTTISTSRTPPARESAASASQTQNQNKKENESKAGLSAKALGKRRRIEPETDDEDEDVDQLIPSDVEEASPTKKARRVRNLRDRSTPARFDVPKEEPASPSPSLGTPKRKRAFSDEGERSDAGPSKRGRVAETEEARAPLLGPILLAAAPRRAWSVEAQPSLASVAVPPAVDAPGPLAVPTPQIPPFMVVLPDLGPHPQQQQQPPPPPPPGPHPLRRTFAKIFTRGG